MTFLALPYPDIDPVAIALGPLSVKWYGLSYVAGILAGWLYLRRLLSTPRLWKDDKPPLTLAQVDDLLVWLTVAIILGGRLGQVLLYDPGYYLANPAEIVKVWKGGMSFHGAVIGSIIAIWAFGRKFGVPFLTVGDLVTVATPFGLFLGRIANFINSEHWGRVAPDVPWAMVFPNGGAEPRHPSQLYEAVLEGLVMFVILRIVTHRMLGLKRPGLTAGVWLAWYAVARSLCEIFREPESLHALNLGPLTAGMLYSLPMLVAGLYIIWRAERRPAHR